MRRRGFLRATAAAFACPIPALAPPAAAAPETLGVLPDCGDEVSLGTSTERWGSVYYSHGGDISLNLVSIGDGEGITILADECGVGSILFGEE